MESNPIYVVWSDVNGRVTKERKKKRKDVERDLLFKKKKV